MKFGKESELCLFLFMLFGIFNDGLLALLVCDYLAILKQCNDNHPSADVAGDSECEPVRVSAPRNLMCQHRGEYLSAPGDAVREVAEADEEGKRPNDHYRAGDRMRSGDEPCHHGDHP